MPAKILLVENIHEVAAERLVSQGYLVDRWSHAPEASELIAKAKDYMAIGIRSKTELTQSVLVSLKENLSTIGCFCIGTNQVDLQNANAFGLPVFNAPHSNTRSVAELVLAEVVALARNLGDRNSKAHLGEWIKSAEGSHEVRGKTLGIIGYGHIGSQVSVLAESFGLKVVFFDVIKKLPLGNARGLGSLKEVLEQSDFITLHVPETPQTQSLIGAEEFKLFKKGSHLINASRGTVVDISALVESLRSKQLAGCAIDVFPIEPASNKERFTSPLQGLSNVILTPHIGGSTEEAQYSIGLEVAESFIRYLKQGSTTGAVNFPIVDLPLTQGAHRILNVHRNEPGVLGEINSIVSQAGANIQAQYLSTDQKIGYLVMDVEKADALPLNLEILKLKRTIKSRIVN
jgi:D-3-phosphoglycerate dehydrogenase